jgi:hypothetical protein
MCNPTPLELSLALDAEPSTLDEKLCDAAALAEQVGNAIEAGRLAMSDADAARLDEAADRLLGLLAECQDRPHENDDLGIDDDP